MQADAGFRCLCICNTFDLSMPTRGASSLVRSSDKADQWADLHGDASCAIGEIHGCREAMSSPQSDGTIGFQKCVLQADGSARSVSE